jgi:lantibiotic transport system permease protein
MKTLIPTLGAEALKLRRTLALWLALIAPLVTAATTFGIFYDRGSVAGADGIGGWVRYGGQNIVVWGLLMLPLFVTLETALLGNMEHYSNHWKHLNALPVPRGVIYAAKQFAGMGLIGLSSAVLVPYTVAGGLLLRLLRPGIGLEGVIPWGQLVTYVGMTYLGAWLLISIHTWLSLRWKSFVVACATGIACTIIGVFVVRADWGPFWPWALPGSLANGFSSGGVLLPELLFGCIGGIVLALWGGWDVTRQDVL